MRKAYAFNGIIFGILAAILTYAETDNPVPTIPAGFGVSAVGYAVIRQVEKLIDRGAKCRGKSGQSTVFSGGKGKNGKMKRR